MKKIISSLLAIGITGVIVFDRTTNPVLSIISLCILMLGICVLVVEIIDLLSKCKIQLLEEDFNTPYYSPLQSALNRKYPDEYIKIHPHKVIFWKGDNADKVYEIVNSIEYQINTKSCRKPMVVYLKRIQIWDMLF